MRGGGGSNEQLSHIVALVCNVTFGVCVLTCTDVDHTVDLVSEPAMNCQAVL